MLKEEFFTTRVENSVRVVAFRQSHILDSIAIERMAARLKELIDAAEEDRFLFDFDHVTYLSSNALGMLIGLQRRILQRKGQLKLAGINSDIMEVFQITKLDTVFDIYKDAAAAIEAYRKNL